MTAWVPVIDVSRHQGFINFATMRAKGVRGLILRVSHGLVLDDRYELYYRDAIAAGFPADQIGAYSFLNPKRSSGVAAAAFAVENIRRITGRTSFLYMLDIENYQNESPNVGTAPVYGPEFAAHIREHIATVRTMSPLSKVIGYTNRAYWNGRPAGSPVGSEWVGDDVLAGELDWIVARYPAYSLAAYERRPLPDTPAGWPEWAFAAAPTGPYPPRGGTWSAWQFSAGYNRQGPTYGCSSSDLDLNFVHPDAWSRWTTTAQTPPAPNPQPVPEPDDVIAIVRDAETNLDKFAVMPDGRLRPLSGIELKARGIVNSVELGAPLTKAERDILGVYAIPAPSATVFTGTGQLTWAGRAS